MRKQSKPKSKHHYLPANERIRSAEVLLVDEDKGDRNVIPTHKALALAKERELDLVLVAPHANPPVAKIVDLGKYRYEKERELRKQKRQQAGNEIKEVRLSPQMEEHDVEQRRKRAEKFLAKGQRVKLSMRFRGRQLIYRNKGIEFLNQFADSLGQQFEDHPKFAGKIVNVLLRPKENNETKE